MVFWLRVRGVTPGMNDVRSEKKLGQVFRDKYVKDLSEMDNMSVIKQIKRMIQAEVEYLHPWEEMCNSPLFPYTSLNPLYTSNPNPREFIAKPSVIRFLK